MDSFTVNVPELKLLREYHADTVCWMSRFNDILLNISEREDQHNAVTELTCILKDGASLKIQGLGMCFLFFFFVFCFYFLSLFYFINFKFYFLPKSFVFCFNIKKKKTVDELPLVEVELQKACCREKALKVNS